MKNFKKVIIMCLAMVLVASLAIAGTIAYLTDTDSKTNVMTVGSVKIEQIEQEYNEAGELVDFTQAKPLMPYVGTLGWKNTTEANGAYRSFTMNNVVDKYVSVTNTGKSDAYVRTVFAFEMGEYATVDAFRYNVIGVSTNAENGAEFDFDGTWNWGTPFVAVIDGENYMVWEAVHSAAVAPKTTTIPSLLQVYMNKNCDNEEVTKVDGNENGTYDILVLSQAVQAAGFDSAEAALTEAFGKVEDNAVAWFSGDDFELPVVVRESTAVNAALKDGKDVYFADDISAPLANGSIYGTPTAITQKNGGVIDGKGNELVVETTAYNAYAIETYGGTIKNLSIKTAMGRGIVISSPTSDILIENVVIDGPGYALNTTEYGAKNLVVNNSTINGWTSLAGLASVTFNNTSFGENSAKYWQNMGYGKHYDCLIRPYCGVEFNSCVFEEEYCLLLDSLGAGQKIILNNCTTNGTKITASNYESYITIELPAGRTLADCVIFK
ncbi:MAG: hypothetical protein E7565_03635 [Ruminococcaceae bacterium]|nr:hypothetical protein [Oscillospiraceae bacterium]